MSARANPRNVRQRKLNTKQPLHVIREADIEDGPDHEAQGHIPQVETGVEKNEEVEFHLQAVINAATQAKQTYIPTPDAVKAKGVKYDELYPRTWREPATYIRFSSTVEDCIGTPYCMNEHDAAFLAQLNDGKDVNGQPIKNKSDQCSEDIFEEVMNCFEETSQRLQPFANLDSAPVLSLREMQDALEEPLPAEANKHIEHIYQYWASRKGSRPLVPTIKVRVLDISNEADDADPYVCFRRREVRQTRKTRGRDAQVVEKLKKMRLELEQARQILQSVRTREELNKSSLEINRKAFEQRKQLKEVKIAKNIVGDKNEDEELLVNQRPQPKPKARDGTQTRGPTIRIASRADRAPETDLKLLADDHAEADAQVQHTIDSRKEQHRRWNHHWQDRTWNPITPPPDAADRPPQWAALEAPGEGYPTPPPSLPSRSSQDRDGDVDMVDQKPDLAKLNAMVSKEPQFNLCFAPPSPSESHYDEDEREAKRQRFGAPMCRIRIGRGGRRHLEMRKQRPQAAIFRGVVSDAESDDEMESCHFVPESKVMEYRLALSLNRTSSQHQQRPSGDQAAIMAQMQAAQAAAAGAQAATGSSTAGSPDQRSSGGNFALH
ncbi:hypothetical protein AC578_1605 [Pseudocercospora eumusae]|uniref:Enhancer of polycomb-like protein n=1 Tax=Pseudocercospora eumusae TaxID=321146 RepID=A0A139HM19_9PEZI|nr:hypothetical protein AC578_1605 [Pseudocercospora eumusae]